MRKRERGRIGQDQMEKFTNNLKRSNRRTNKQADGQNDRGKRENVWMVKSKREISSEHYQTIDSVYLMYSIIIKIYRYIDNLYNQQSDCLFFTFQKKNIEKKVN